MSRKDRNRIQQPYGYREENKYESSAAMLATAISNIDGGGGDEKFEEIVKMAFTGAEYNPSTDTITFSNYIGHTMDSVNVLGRVEGGSFSKSDNILKLNLRGGATVEIPIEGFVTAEDLDAEANERHSADSDILQRLDDVASDLLDRISSVENSVSEEAAAREQADSSIQGEIDAEAESRIAADEALDEKIASEKESRETADAEIWEAIENIGEADDGIIERLNREIEDRQEADSALLEALNAEIAAREEGDTDIRENYVSNEKLEAELLNYILLSEKGAPEGVATLSESGKVVAEQLDMPWNGVFTGDFNANDTTPGVWGVDHRVIDQMVLGGEEAHGVMLVFPDMYKTTVFVVGRAHGSDSGTTPEIYARRWLTGSQSWTDWFTTGDLAKKSDVPGLVTIPEYTSSVTEMPSVGENSTGISFSIDKDGVPVDDILTIQGMASSPDWDSVTGMLISPLTLKNIIKVQTENDFNYLSGMTDSLSGSLEAEIQARRDGDSELSQQIIAERADRISADTALEAAVSEERTERQAEDGRLSEAISDEAAERSAGDAQLSAQIDTNKVKIESVTGQLESNVREAFKLTNANGVQQGETIRIYKDSSLKNVELVSEHDGITGQFLKFTYILADGSESVQYVNVSDFLTETEFQDGLTVIPTGQVRVLIDPTSEPYLTVSTDGVKFDGLDSVISDLEGEKAIRQTMDATLETAIEAERTNRMTDTAAIRSDLIAEANSRESADEALSRRITNEISDRIAGDESLNTQIQLEKTIRETTYNSMSQALTETRRLLTDESNTRASADLNLQRLINELQLADSLFTTQISNLSDGLSSEAEARRNADSALENTVRQKANSADVYYKREADALFATKEEIPTDFYTKSEVDAKFPPITESIDAETDAREQADAELERAIEQETAERISGDTNLNVKIESIRTLTDGKLDDVNVDETVLTIDKEDPNLPYIGLRLSGEEGQIVKKNADGVFASATLDYDAAENTLTFTTSNAAPKRIPLLSNSMVDRVYYDSSTEEIVIEYTVNGVRMDDVRVPVASLIEEWRTEDGHEGAIALTKERKQGGEQDVLSARLIVNTTHSDNAAEIDGNSLYVSKNAIVAELEERVAQLESVVNERLTLWQNL